MAQDKRHSSWIDWYHFAREVLGCTHDESVTYANLRFVEEQNRDQRQHRAA
jgi:hypothetical protein